MSYELVQHQSVSQNKSQIISSSDPIFNYTEVAIPEMEKSSAHLPAIQEGQRFKPILKRPKSISVLPVLPSLKKKGRWQDFLKRNCSTINTSMQSSKVQSMIEDVQEKVKQDFSYAKDLKDLEHSSVLTQEKKQSSEDSIQFHSVYNDLKNQNQKLTERVASLEHVLFSLEEEESEEQRTAALKLSELRSSYKDLEKKTSSEIMYQESLVYMKNKIRSSLIAISHQAKSVQNQLKIILAKCDDAHKNYTRISSKTLAIDKNTKKVKKDLTNDRNQRDKMMTFALSDYEKRERLKQCAKIEKEKQVIIAKHKEKVHKINDLEKKLRLLRQEDMISEEQSRIESDIEKQEQRFAMIQRVINVATIDDIIPYYDYLTKNTKFLQAKVEENLELIKNLQRAKTTHSKELKELSLIKEANAEKIHTPSIIDTENKIDNTKKRIKELKNELKILKDIHFAAYNVFSRVFHQVSEPDFELNSTDLSLCIAYCYYRLEKLMESLYTQHNAYYIESVNTAIEYHRAPHFLNLNFSSYSSLPEEDLNTL